MKISLISILCAAAVPLAGAAEAESRPATNRVVLSAEYISLLAQQLRTNHPGVAAADARAFAAAQNLRAVRTWEDPMVRLGGMAAREPMRADEGDLLYGVEQKLPLFGKPRLARAVAAAEIEVAQANTEYQFQLRRVEFTKHILQAAVNDHFVAIGRQDLQWLDTVLSSLESRIATGQASQLELLKAQNEKSKRAERLTTDINQRFHDRVAPDVVSRLSASATGSGFSVSRSSLRCIFAMSLVRKQRLASPSPCSAMTARIRSAAVPSPLGAINSSVMLSSVNNTRSAPSPLFCQAGDRANSIW